MELRSKYSEQLYNTILSFYVAMKWLLMYIIINTQLHCCGVSQFTDYRIVFNNFSMPVSCCNTTSPLTNETTCLQIVEDGLMANQTGLIYFEVIV